MNIKYKITYRLFHYPACCQLSIIIKHVNIEHIRSLTHYSLIEHLVSYLLRQKSLQCMV